MHALLFFVGEVSPPRRQQQRSFSELQSAVSLGVQRMSGVKLRIQSFSESVTHEFILGFKKYIKGMMLTYVLILGSPVFVTIGLLKFFLRETVL